MSTNITEEELAEARKIWGDALVAVWSLDLALSSSVLVAIIQPARFPLAFGGWAIGRLACLSNEVDVAFSVVELVDEEGA